MIEITKYPNGYTVIGHAGFAIMGQDIVCAGISILAQTGMYMLMDVGNFDVNHATGYLSIFVDEEHMDYDAIRIKAILDTIDEGFSLMHGQYPDYITIKEETEWQKSQAI